MQEESNTLLAIVSDWDMLIRPRYFCKVQPGEHNAHPYVYMSSGRKTPHGIGSQDLRFTIETEVETDGRWIAEIPQVPGALAYGSTKEEAVNKAYAIALRSVADDVEHSDDAPPNSISLERHIA